MADGRTDEDATGDVVCSFFRSFPLSVSHSLRSPHFTSRIGQHSVVRRTERRVGNSGADGRDDTSESAPAKVPDFVPRKDVGIFCVLGIILTISANNGQKTEFVSKSSTGGLMDSRGG